MTKNGLERKSTGRLNELSFQSVRTSDLNRASITTVSCCSSIESWWKTYRLLSTRTRR